MKLKQRSIIYITFVPSKGSEIQKRRPALVMSRNNYNLASNLVIVCPITTTSKQRPYLIPLHSEIQNRILKPNSKVNTMQVYTLDVTPEGHRRPEYLGRLNRTEFLMISERFLQNFNLPF